MGDPGTPRVGGGVPGLVLSMKRVQDISVFNPTGEIDPVDGGHLLDRICELMERDLSKIVLDLSEVDHIHYRFLAKLTALARISLVMSGGIKLANVTPYNQEIIRLMGAERFFETYDSVAEAILSFPSGTLGQGGPGDSCTVH